jgi:hypothetical protein
MHRCSLPLLLGVALPSALPAQHAPACAVLLEGFRAKIEANYAGFHLEVRGARRRAYDERYERLAREASAAAGEACFFVLDRFVGWFDDPHVFVFQSTHLDTATTAERARAVRISGVTESTARSYLSTAGRRLDPIEGIWYDGRGLRVAVVADSEGADTFRAVVLTSDTTLWPVGAVRASIARREDGRYRVDLYERNFALRHLDAAVHKEVLLRLSPGIWGREFPRPSSEGLVDRRDPRRPTLVRWGNTVVVSVVSHDPAYARAFDSLVSASDSALRSAERLIVDLRGNEGGSSWVTNPLLPFIESRERRAGPYGGDRTVMLSSPDQIAYARSAFGPDTAAFVRELIGRLTASPGEFVPLPSDPPAAPDAPLLGPPHVAIVTDGGTVSAGEVLVLKALRSTRARVFGQPTAGALDYPSVNVVRVAPGEQRWHLGYPTMASSAHLPRNGMRGKGIAPDARIAVWELWPVIVEVDRRLRGG